MLHHVRGIDYPREYKLYYAGSTTCIARGAQVRYESTCCIARRGQVALCREYMLRQGVQVVPHGESMLYCIGSTSCTT